MAITGVVTSKRKDGTAIQIDGDKDKWFKGTEAGLRDIKWKDEVSLEYTGSGRDKTVVSIEKLSEAPAVSAKPAARQQGGFNDPNRNTSIIYQSSRKDAVQVACSMVETGILPLPAAKQSKFDAALAFIDELTDRFFKEAMTVSDTGELPVRESE